MPASLTVAAAGGGEEARSLLLSLAGLALGLLLGALLARLLSWRRPRAEATAREKEQRYRLLFQAARDPILLLDLEGHFIDGNEAAKQAFGVTSLKDLMGQPPTRFSPDLQPDGQLSSAKANQMICTAFSEGSVQFEWTHRRLDGSEFVAEVALTAIRTEHPPVLMAHLRDITSLKETQAALRERMQLEEAILRASTRFISVPLEQLDAEMDRALQDLGRFAEADRAYVFQFREDGVTMDCTHEWCRPGVSEQIAALQNLPLSDFPWFVERIQRREVVPVPRVRELPPEAAAERKEFEREGIQSMICVPMLVGDQVVGFLGFDFVRAEQVWAEETVTLLRVAADAITDVLVRKRAEQALRESRERYRSLVETTSDWIWEVDAEGVYTYASPKVKELLGYEPEEVVGKTPFDFMAPAEARRVAAAVLPHFARREPFSHLKNLNLRKDGREVLLDSSGVPVFDEQGEFRGFRGIDRDITELRQAEEAVSRRLRLEELLIWASSRLISLEPEDMDAEIDRVLGALGEFAEADRAYVLQMRDEHTAQTTHEWCRAGVSPQIVERAILTADEFPWYAERLRRREVILVPRLRDLPPEAASERREMERQGIESQIAVPMVLGEQVLGYLGFDSVTAESAWSEETVALLRGAASVIANALTRRRAEEALRQSEARLRALFAGISDLILVMDREGRYLEIVPTKFELLHRSASELLGKTVWEVFPEPQAKFFAEHIRRALDTRETVSMEYSLMVGDKLMRFAAALSPLAEDTVIVVARDVTTQVEQYEQLLAAERSRAALAEHLNAEVNHRARNNLAIVSGLLQMQALQESDRRVALQLREAVARIRTFVDIHETIYAAGVEEVDLLEVLRQVASTLRAVFAAAGADLAVTGEPQLCPTRAATNLAVVTNELITNALKHGGPGADGELHITVHLSRGEGWLGIQVRNSGTPVPQDFDLAAAAGMGLRLTTSMAEQYGGTFSLRPTEGGSVAELIVAETALRE